MGRSPATAEKGAVMKDARHETSAEEEASKRPGTHNEEPSRTVAQEKPENKETKMANPKAVMPDNQRLGTEVGLSMLVSTFSPGELRVGIGDGELTGLQKAEKSNTLTGQSK